MATRSTLRPFMAICRAPGSNIAAATFRPGSDVPWHASPRRATDPVADLRKTQTSRRRLLLRTADEIAGIRALLVVPMRKENDLVGAFVIYRNEVRPFTDKQIELVIEFRPPGGHRHRKYPSA